MARVYNFSAGPAILPEPVLQQTADEMMNYKGSGMSVAEISHRSDLFVDLLEEAKQDLCELAGIPDNYKILFLQGGASLQFAMVPLNLMRSKKADYILTGSWAVKAAREASRYGDVRILASSEDRNWCYIPDLTGLVIRPDADYVYICENNTIYGTRYTNLPDTQGKTLVSDMSSCLLSEPLDISRYGVIFAGAQKNIGPAGVTLVIIHEDLIPNEVLPGTPTMLSYNTHAVHNSLFNTPPCLAIYMCGLVFKWLLAQGGLETMQKLNQRKAGYLYDYLDQSRLFKGTVDKAARSLMNVPFITGDEAIDRAFVEAAANAGLLNLKGHRSVGGMRASIYNAMPEEGVLALVRFMEQFEKENV